MGNSASKMQKQPARQIRHEGEDGINNPVVHNLLPIISKLPDRRLAKTLNHSWANSVPVPLNPALLNPKIPPPLPLPKPEPDLAFGYSDKAFSSTQLATIERLTDNSGRSFVVPDRRLHFPFLCVEFNSQFKGDSHRIVTHQAAGAGAIALQGIMNLMERTRGRSAFDYAYPQFWSVTMNHDDAWVNLHWVKAGVDGGPPSFHIKRLSKHRLADAEGLRAINRVIKNILDDAIDTRLKKLCQALDNIKG